MQISILGAPDFLPDPLSYELPKNVIQDFAQKYPDSATKFENDPIGFKVEVEFGRGKGRKTQGIIVGVEEQNTKSNEFTIKKVLEIASCIPLLNKHLIEFYTDVSKYYGTSLSNLLPLIIPTRSVQIEKQYAKLTKIGESIALPFLHTNSEQIIHEYIREHQHLSSKVSVRVVPKLNEWALTIIKLAFIDIFHNRSVLILLPTDYMLTIFEELLQKLFFATFPDANYAKHCIKYCSNLTTKERNTAFFNCLYTTGPKIVFGTKSASLSPFIPDSVYIWNDNNINFKELRTPYYNAREVLLLRKSNYIRFVSFVPSPTVLRLIIMGFLDEFEPESSQLNTVAKKITSIHAQFGEKLPPYAFSVIRQALDNDQPVLLLYPKSGNVRLMLCKNCNEVAVCKNCDSALITNEKRVIVCANCEEKYNQYHCHKCNSNIMRMASVGNDEIAFQVGKSFPEIPIIASSFISANGVVREVEDHGAICVATPGAEPIAQNGYGAVIIMDAGYWNAILSFDGTNDTLSRWFYAVSLLASTPKTEAKNIADPQILRPEKRRLSEVLLLGQTDIKYQNTLQMLDPRKISRSELAARKIGNLPPFRRFMLLSGHPLIVQKLIIEIEMHNQLTEQNTQNDSKFEILGPFSLEDSGYYKLWQNTFGCRDFICYFIAVDMVKNGSTDLAKLVKTLKIKGNTGWTLDDKKRVSINQKYPVKFILDPKELI